VVQRLLCRLRERQVVGVVHHSLLLLGGRERSDLVQKGFWFGQALGVRPIGAQQDAVQRQMRGGFLDAVFNERSDPAMFDELIDGRLGEHSRIFAREHR